MLPCCQGADTDAAAVARIDAAMAAGEPAGVEYITYAKNGAKFWSSVSVTPVHNEAGELEHIVGASVARSNARRKGLNLSRASAPGGHSCSSRGCQNMDPLTD